MPWEHHKKIIMLGMTEAQRKIRWRRIWRFGVTPNLSGNFQQTRQDESVL